MESAAARRLAANLNADVHEYGRLMADDEAATVRTITAYRGGDDGSRRRAPGAGGGLHRLRIDPKFSLERFAKRLLYRNQADTGRAVDALRKSGLK